MTIQNLQATGVLEEGDICILKEETHDDKPLPPRKYIYVWKNIMIYIHLHLAAFYGLYLMFVSAKVQTNLFAIFFVNLSTLGITAGAHRLWSHRSYKVKTPLKIMILVFQTLAFQNSAIEWARDHRVHHKYSETDADPHNAKRGFFFSHIGWLLTKKHPFVKEKGKTIDISDLTNDPLLTFQAKHYLPLVLLICFLIPTGIPMYFWKETFWNAFLINLTRYCASLHVIWLINSAAHMYGQRPFDRYINPSENKTVSIVNLGEGWHNYHHTFPWDYEASEHGKFGMNLTATFINFMATIGQAYDLKSVSEDVIKKRVLRTGDGTHHKYKKDAGGTKF